MTIGERIKSARNKKGWNQARLAREADMAQAVLSRIENGLRQPAIESLEALARALEIPPGELIAPELPAGIGADLNLSPDLLRDIADLPPEDRGKVEEYVRALHALHHEQQRQRPHFKRDTSVDTDQAEPPGNDRRRASARRRRAEARRLGGFRI